MVTDIEGVVNDEPVPSDVPPKEAAYQFITPAEVVALNTKVPASHLEAGVVDKIVGVLFMVASTGVRDEVQFAVEAST